MCLATPSFAHQQNAALTQVLMNPNTGLLEISHRFWLHDAEHAVKRLFGADHDIIADEQSQRQFAEYVMSRFNINTHDGKELLLTFVGTEIERGYIWIYQETKPDQLSKSMIIRHDALMEIWPQQENMVSIEGLGELKTLYLNRHNDSQTISID